MTCNYVKRDKCILVVTWDVTCYTWRRGDQGIQAQGPGALFLARDDGRDTIKTHCPASLDSGSLERCRGTSGHGFAESRSAPPERFPERHLGRERQWQLAHHVPILGSG